MRPLLRCSSWRLPRGSLPGRGGNAPLLLARGAAYNGNDNGNDNDNNSFSNGRPSCAVQHRASLVTLAIETSCDDTAVAVLRHTPRSTELLFNERISSDNRAFGGIHPLVAAKGHAAALAPLVRRALAALPKDEEPGSKPEPKEDNGGGQAHCWAADGTRRRVPDFVAVTRGPGMRGNLGIGLDMAKGLAVAWGVPLVGVHHMQAHALTPRLARALGMSMGEAEGEAEGEGDASAAASTASSPSSAASEPTPEFPFLSLLVSGGHTQLVYSAGLTDHSLVATTGDIAVGNLLDQTARDILPADVLAASDTVMYGRLLEAFAFPETAVGAGAEARTRPPAEHEGYDAVWTPAATRHAEMTPRPTGFDWDIPLPFRQTRRLAFSFSSIYTRVHDIAAAAKASSSPSPSPSSAMDIDERRALAQHTMAAAFGHIAGRLCLALEDRPELRAARTLVVAGGVASNRFLMHVLRATLAARGHGHLRILAPPVALCTDNAAMIAWTAVEMFLAGYRSDLSITAIGRWPMDPEHGEGILGVDGWIKEEPAGP